MRRVLIAVPFLWLLGLFLIPFAIVFKMSLSDYALSIPPYTPQLDASAGWSGLLETFSAFDLENFDFIGANWIVLALGCVIVAGFAARVVYLRALPKGTGPAAVQTAITLGLLLGLSALLAWSLANWLGRPDDLYWKAYLSSVRIAAISTVLALAIGYPIAYAMARAPTTWRPTLVMLVILPFWTSFLIRVYAWQGILASNGHLNNLLINIGLIDEPLKLLNTPFAVYVGIVYTYLPFMVLPIYASLERLDKDLEEAALDLGCSRFTAFWLVTWRLSRPGVIAGAFLVFIPVIGEFVIPSLLGGSDTLMIGKVLWDEFFANRDWPLASAVAVILLMVLIIPIILFQRSEQRRQEAEQ